MIIYVSLCCKSQPPYLLQLNIEKESFHPINFNIPFKIKNGFLGLDSYEDHFFVSTSVEQITKSVHGVVMVFDRKWKRESVINFPQVKDIHDVKVNKENIYVVSTGTDSIWSKNIQAKGNPQCIFKASSTEGDNTHLNCLCLTSHGILASCFGKKTKERWDNIKSGYVFNVNNPNDLLISDLHHPHSILERPEGIYVLSSSSQEIITPRERVCLNKGFLRGLIVTDEYLIIGSSGSRAKSKSTGAIVSRLASNGAVHVYKNEYPLHPIQSFIKTIPLPNKEWEIYDILPKNK